jgi:Uma2 family endonuclease
MSTTTRWTSKDLESLPDDGTRYEIIDGELFMSKQPHYYHQDVCSRLHVALANWNSRSNLGNVVEAPGLILAEDDDVAPDLVWLSHARLAESLQTDGHLHTAPELVIEVLSPGRANERRDREAKLKLYSRRGVGEYWIASWQTHTVEVYRRKGERVELEKIFSDADTLASPLLPGFSCPIADVFSGTPVAK